MKKICFITTYADFPRQRMLAYYEKLIPKNIEIFVLCKKGEKQNFNTTRAKIFEYNSKKSLLSHELRKFCIKNNIDILTNLSGGTKMAFIMAFSTLFTNIKNIFYEHGNPKLGKLLALPFFQFFIDRILIGTEDLAAKTKKYLFFSKKKIFVLPTAINTDFFRPLDREKLRKKYKIKANEKVICFVGRVEYLKGSDFLLKTIKNNPDKKFILIGRLEDKDYDKKELKNVIFVEKADQDQILEYHNISDLFLFLSRREGLGLAYREAMSSGIPAIVADIEAVRTVDMTKKVRFDEKEIQKAIDDFFSLSEKQKKELSNKTREYIIQKHSEKALKSEHITAFLDI